METLSRLLRPREIVFAAFLDAMPEMQSEMIGQLRERLSDDHIEVTELLAHHLLKCNRTAAERLRREYGVSPSRPLTSTGRRPATRQENPQRTANP